MNQCKCCGGMGCEVCGYGAGFASPVQGAASASEAPASPTDADRLQALRDESDRRHIEAQGTLRGATSSASGAKGAAVKPWQERLPLCPTPDELHAAKDAEIADLRALAERAQVQPSGAVAEWVNEEQGFQYLIHGRLPDGTKLCIAPAPEQEAAQVGAKAEGQYVVQDVTGHYYLGHRRFVEFKRDAHKFISLHAAQEVARLLTEAHHQAAAGTVSNEVREFKLSESAKVIPYAAPVEQEAAPKCPRCKDTRTWTYTEEPGDHGDEYPCMDCGVAAALEAAPQPKGESNAS